jgi:hypothetical protein
MDVYARGLPGGPMDDVHRVVVGDQLRQSAAVIMPSKRSDQVSPQLSHLPLYWPRSAVSAGQKEAVRSSK